MKGVDNDLDLLEDEKESLEGQMKKVDNEFKKIDILAYNLIQNANSDKNKIAKELDSNVRTSNKIKDLLNKIKGGFLKLGRIFLWIALIGFVLYVLSFIFYYIYPFVFGSLIALFVTSVITYSSWFIFYYKNKSHVINFPTESMENNQSRFKRIRRRMKGWFGQFSLTLSAYSNNYNKAIKLFDEKEKRYRILFDIENALNHYRIRIPRYTELEKEIINIKRFHEENIINHLLQVIAKATKIKFEILFLLFYEYRGVYDRIRGQFDYIKRNKKNLEYLAQFLMEYDIIPAKEFDLELDHLITILQSSERFRLNEISKKCFLSQSYFNHAKQFSKFLKENGYEIKKNLELANLLEFKKLSEQHVLRGSETHEIILFIEIISRELFYQVCSNDNERIFTSKIAIFFYFKNKNRYINQICSMIASDFAACRFLFYYIYNDSLHLKNLSEIISLYQNDVYFQSKIDNEYENEFKWFHKDLINGIWNPSQDTLWINRSKEFEVLYSKKFKGINKLTEFNFDLFQASKNLIRNQLKITTFFKILSLNGYIPFQISFKSASGIKLADEIDRLNPNLYPDKEDVNDPKLKELLKINFTLTGTYYNSARLGIIKWDDFLRFKSLSREILDKFIANQKKFPDREKFSAGFKIQAIDIHTARYEESGTINTYQEVIDLLPQDINALKILSVGKLENTSLEFKDILKYISLYDMLRNSDKLRLQEKIQFLIKDTILKKFYTEFHCEDSLQLIEIFDFKNKNRLLAELENRMEKVLQSEENFQLLENNLKKSLIHCLSESIFSLNRVIKLYF